MRARNCTYLDLCAKEAMLKSWKETSVRHWKTRKITAADVPNAKFKALHDKYQKLQEGVNLRLLLTSELGQTDIQYDISPMAARQCRYRVPSITMLN